MGFRTHQRDVEDHARGVLDNHRRTHLCRVWQRPGMSWSCLDHPATLEQAHPAIPSTFAQTRNGVFEEGKTQNTTSVSVFPPFWVQRPARTAHVRRDPRDPQREHQYRTSHDTSWRLQRAGWSRAHARRRCQRRGPRYVQPRHVEMRWPTWIRKRELKRYLAETLVYPRGAYHSEHIFP